MRISDRIKGLSLIAIVFLVGIIFTIRNIRIQKLPKVYTSGTIIKIWKPARGEIAVGYEYEIKGQKHKNTVDRYGFEDITSKWKTFIVEVPIGFDNHGVMRLDIPIIPDANAGYAGWITIPDSVLHEVTAIR